MVAKNATTKDLSSGVIQYGDIMNQAAIETFDTHYGLGTHYTSPTFHPGMVARYFPSLAFYTYAITGPVWRLCYAAKVGKCTDVKWSNESVGIAKVMEKVGARIEIEGLEHVDAVQEPCIFVGNHMSTLETFLLPGIIRPRRPVTFVIKDALMKVPFFKDVLATRDVIVVGRSNPREDLKLVMEEGKKRLDAGKSLIIFPQSTRSVEFNVKKFNSIAAKLAKHSGSPMIPLALKTDAWAQGKLVKDFGAVHPERTIHFAFGKALYVQEQGKTEHAQICAFIEEHLKKWS